MHRISTFKRQLTSSVSNQSKDLLIPQNEQNQKTVIVIGAGTAGLAAAKKLRESNTGVKVIILESSDRIGGRISTKRDFGFTFEEGAQWIHGQGENPINSLADLTGTKSFVIDEENIKVYDVGGKVVPKEVFSVYQDQFNYLYENLSQVGSVDKDFESLFTLLYPERTKDRIWKWFISRWLAFVQGDLKNLSSLNYNQEDHFEGDHKLVQNGFDRIIVELGKDAKVEFN